MSLGCVERMVLVTRYSVEMAQTSAHPDAQEDPVAALEHNLGAAGTRYMNPLP